MQYHCYMHKDFICFNFILLTTEYIFPRASFILHVKLLFKECYLLIFGEFKFCHSRIIKLYKWEVKHLYDIHKFCRKTQLYFDTFSRYCIMRLYVINAVTYEYLFHTFVSYT